MQEERKRILEMVKSGMLTVDEADKLLSELDQAQKKKEETEKRINQELSSYVFEGEEDDTRKTFEAKAHAVKDKLIDLFDTAMKKVKDLDLDFHHSVRVSHVFQQNANDFDDLVIDIPNGSVTLSTWDHTDVRVECEGKVYRTENPQEGKERFLHEIDFKVDDGTMSFLSKEKITKVDARIFIPEKNYEKIYVKLFNGPITGKALNAKKLSFQTMNGQIKLAHSQGEKAKVETGNGHITVSDSKFNKLETETINGKVSIDGIYEKIETETISGSITAYLQEPQPEVVNLSSASGTITVKVPKDLPISGEIKSNLGTVKVDLDSFYKISEEKEIIQKSIRFDTTAELKNKTYLFAEAKMGAVYVQPL